MGQTYRNGKEKPSRYGFTFQGFENMFDEVDRFLLDPVESSYAWQGRMSSDVAEKAADAIMKANGTFKWFRFSSGKAMPETPDELLLSDQVIV